MEFETLRITDNDAIRTVELNRPEALNAFSAQLMDDLADIFLDTAVDESIKVLILTGAGRAFSAGADLTEMGRPAKPPKHGFAVMLDAIVDFPKPFIVAVNGIGAGIGATICGLADFTIIANEARLRCPFSTLGLTAEAGSTYLFPFLMGRQKASWFLLSAEWMSGSECEASGLAMMSVPLEQLTETVNAKAQTLAKLPIASLMQTKKLIVDPHREQLKTVFMEENKALAKLVGGPANKEALSAFVEKREPNFSGL